MFPILMQHSAGPSGCSRPSAYRWRSGHSSMSTTETARGVIDESEIARIFRAEYGRAVAVVTRTLGDLDLAEDAVQDAFAIAIGRWPTDGIPPSPAGWIITTA